MPFREKLKQRWSRFIGSPKVRTQTGASDAASPSQGPSSTTPPPVSPNDTTESWPRLRSFFRMLDRSPVAFGPLKVVTSGLVDCIEIFEKAAGNRKEYNNLENELERLFEILEHYFAQTNSAVMTGSMEGLCKSIQKEIEHVQVKKTRGGVDRRLDAREDSDDVLLCYQRIQIYLQRLSLNVDLSMWKIMDERATDALLDRLCSSMSPCYNSSQADELKRGACAPGTRTEVLARMHGWVHNPATGSVYWLNGMAGTGKTTIAYTLCAELDADFQLGASFFCSRSLPECRSVNLIIPSIAYQLAQFSRPFRSALSQVLEKERNAHTRQLRIQFESLIVKPLGTVRDTLPDDLVVVIDALDECDNQQSTGWILDALFTKTPNLPIKFFVSSRPEPEIRDQMQKQGDDRESARLVLHELDKGMVQEDIEKYLRVALAPIHPMEEQIKTLVERAGILFIYAATVVRYIGYDSFRRNPHTRLETVLNASTTSGVNPYKDIDELYTLILKAAIDDRELSDPERDDIKLVLHTTICAREPLTISAISGLMGLHNVKRVQTALQPLWSVLHVVETSGLVTTLHASFPDYMFNPRRSQEYHCNSAAHDQTIARCCFDCINATTPHFNICGLESSYVPDDNIPNLVARVERTIPLELSYACHYWAAHLEHTQGSSDVVKLVECFLSNRLLLWMEVMNLKKRMHNGLGVMQLVEDWCVRQSCSEELRELAHDAWRFVAAFSSSPASQSTPHIYVSMLPFWPEATPIAKCYGKHIQVPMVPQGPAIARRQLELLATWFLDGEVRELSLSRDGTQMGVVAGGRVFVLDGLTGRMLMGPLEQKAHSARSIAYSPDGTCIVSGFEDGSLCTWSSENGRIMLGPLNGHTLGVGSVAFSADGTRIVSGSDDSTVRVWDASSGRAVLDPLIEHTDQVTSVTFSPDGTRIASGSSDESIFIWDAQSGNKVLGPLTGHTDSIRSLAFSPDGTRIVSGSNDKSIRMWDPQTGHAVLAPLEGHTDQVISVAFSPDSTRIVSGSDDNTICIWDAQSGKTLLGPLTRHSNSVNSVAFLPDSTRIISGSGDKTIRMWDTRSGQVVVAPLEGHNDQVISVAFSPDGSRIVSGSDDNTIRIWAVGSGEAMFAPLTEHTDSLNSVAFSPDGTRIVSGSDDCSIRLWDARSGQIVHGPLTAHTNSVNSVSFSFDGSRIVSGSDDKTIHVWDAEHGQTVRDPLKGHTNLVNSVAFSPDGSHIVSGSGDKSLCIWDAQSGEMILGPLTGHTKPINSVSFSPDGTLIVSGSHDKTIRVWDARSGQKILGPLKGHEKPVNSVAFSPDGNRIVSGSWDNTICIWDARSGKIVIGPLKGHTDSVNSVAFSSDGTRIVSGSGDNSILVWDARSGPTAAQSSESELPTVVLWDIDANGWVRDNQSRLLVWVPPDLRDLLLSPRGILKISTQGYVRLNFDGVQIGESWGDCYQFV